MPYKHWSRGKRSKVLSRAEGSHKRGRVKRGPPEWQPKPPIFKPSPPVKTIADIIRKQNR